MKQRAKEQNGMKCDNACQVASARTFALAGSGRLRTVEGLISQQESERIPNLRSLYMVVGTGSRSTAEVPVVFLLVQYRRAVQHAAGASVFGKRHGVARLVGLTWQLSWNWVEDVAQTWPFHLQVGRPELLVARCSSCCMSMLV